LREPRWNALYKLTTHIIWSITCFSDKYDLEKSNMLFLFHRSKTTWKGTGQTCSAPWDQEVNLSLGARNSVALCPSKDKCWNCSTIYQD
jgi:hypothetical protein